MMRKNLYYILIALGFLVSLDQARAKECPFVMNDCLSQCKDDDLDKVSLCFQDCSTECNKSGCGDSCKTPHLLDCPYPMADCQSECEDGACMIGCIIACNASGCGNC